jgi:D-glycero-D-manno-heptose 1,7-bisphosphate phosphatase
MLTGTRRALFLDRDGIINVNHGYVCDPQRTEFVEGIFDLCGIATKRNYLVVVITNQAGIARGYYTEQQFLDYMNWVGDVFVEHGARLDSVYYCPHHPTEGIGPYLRCCECRKPGAGMIWKARVDLHIDLAHSILVGDEPTDIEAGRKAGVGTCLQMTPVVLPGSGRMALGPANLSRVLLAMEEVSGSP